jgi:hypothetical protein
MTQTVTAAALSAAKSEQKQRRALADQRISLRVSELFLLALDHLAGKEGLARADIIRRSLGLYALSSDKERKGFLVGFARFDRGSMTVDTLISLKPEKVDAESLGLQVANQKQSYTRIELRATSDFFTALEELAKRDNLPKSDVIRRSVGLYSLVRSNSAKGLVFAVFRANEGNSGESPEIEQVINL